MEIVGRLLPAPGELVDKAKSLLRFRSRALLIGGLARNSSHRLNLLYLGNRTNLAFVLRFLFAEQTVAADRGACNIWRALELAEEHSRDVDITVFDVPWPWELDFERQHRVIEMPSWVRQAVRLGDTWDDVMTELHRSARGEQMRKVRKHGLVAGTTTDPAEISSFYDTMYVPHTRRRFGPDASIDSRSGLLKAARGGALLQIRKDRRVIAASLLCKAGSTLKSLYTGFAGPDLRQVDGATAALYYHALRYAFENGFRTVDYCGSRPLLNDGVFETKRRWGGAVYDDWCLESLLVRLQRFSPGIEDFLCGTPLLIRQDGQLIGKVMSREAPLSPAGVQAAIQRCVSRGMDGLSVYALHGVTPDAASAATGSSIPVALHDLRESADPLRTYCDA